MFLRVRNKSTPKNPRSSWDLNPTHSEYLHTIKLGFSSTSTGSTPKNGKDDLDGKWIGFFPSGANQRIKARLPISVKKVGFICRLVHYTKGSMSKLWLQYWLTFNCVHEVYGETQAAFRHLRKSKLQLYTWETLQHIDYENKTFSTILDINAFNFIYVSSNTGFHIILSNCS